MILILFSKFKFVAFLTSVLVVSIVNAQKSEPKNTVLVELFTSEGCSSCPSADKVLATLDQEFRTKNLPVNFIAYHVDYWDYLGWKDRFSSSTYTKRQKDYAAALGLNSIYTPQVVINGKSELVGSSLEKIQTIINKELVLKQTQNLDVIAKFDKNSNEISLAYTFQGNPEPSEIYVALIKKFENTKVLKGENEGEDLKHVNIVQQLVHEKLKERGEIRLKIDNRFKSNEFTIIAFVQKNKNKNIISSTLIESKALLPTY